MSEAIDPPRNPASPPWASAWLAQSHDLLALTDAAGRIEWANAAFEAATGLGASADLLGLAPADWLGGAPRGALQALLRADSHDAATELALRSTSAATLWVRPRVTQHADRRLWTLKDDTATHDLGRSLGNAREQLQMITGLGKIAVWRHDLKTNRLHYNERGYELLGLPFRPDGLTFEEGRALVHPDDLPRVVASAAQALQTNQPHDIETRMRHGDGSWRDLLVRRVVQRGPAGEPLAFVGVALDVTEQTAGSRRAEQLALRLEAAAQAARVGIWTTTIGDSGISTVWNTQMYRLFDRAEPSVPPTLDEWLAGCVHPDDAARVGKAVRDHLRNGQGTFETEFRTPSRGGRTRWMLLRSDVDRGNAGIAPVRVFGIAMDVTDRHEALTALHAASERAAFIAQQAGIGTWESTDPDLPVLWDEQMFRLLGLEPSTITPDRAARLAIVHPDDRDRMVDANRALSTSARPLAYEYRARLPDGSYRWLASRSAALRDAHGTVVRRVGVNWDITESKNADLARQQAALAERESQAKSQFLSRMSHELRTPLNAVLGFTQLLEIEAQRSPDPTQATKLGHIRAAGEYLLTLIDDALDLSSLEAGTLKLNLQVVPIAQAVAVALPLAGELARAHGVTVQIGSLEGAVRGDPVRLRQVLLNLLTNAIKYNRHGGEVFVESARDGDQVRVRVRDTGRGMAPQQLAHLFEPFNRLGVENEGIEGSGIGLTIVKALVERMGGRIAATSRPGQGTVFEVTLPAAEAPADAPGAEPRASHALALAPHRERDGQLLYIEDNSVNVLLVEELVKSLAGLRIVSEPTGTAGVARARSLRPNVILVDMQLPDFDGFEVLRRLRAQPETAAIPCIALSANAMPEDIARGLASGFDDYWTKPIQFKPFLDALERLFPA